MTDKNKKAIWTVVIIAAVAALGYFVYTNRPAEGVSAVTTPEGRGEWINNIYTKVIDNPTAQDFERLLAMGDDYLKAWSDAINAGVQTFMLNGKKFLTQSGTATA